MKEDFSEEMLDLALDRLYPVPDGLANRVKLACHRAEMKRRRQSFGNWRKMAAILVMTTLVSAIIASSVTYHYSVKEQRALLASAMPFGMNARQNDGVDQNANGSDAYQNGTMSAQYDDNARNDSQTTRLVTTMDTAVMTNQTPADSTIYVVPNQIHHVWRAQNIQALQTLAEECGCKVVDDGQTNDGCPKFVCVASDANIQKLVNTLYQNGWILYSAEYPQPNCDHLMAFGKDQVQYGMTVVNLK